MRDLCRLRAAQGDEPFAQGPTRLLRGRIRGQCGRRLGVHVVCCKTVLACLPAYHEVFLRARVAALCLAIPMFAAAQGTALSMTVSWRHAMPRAAATESGSNA